jgi:UDP-3-O-[3-hydroxymyristoyl] glucosamine N-acyltransferase
VVGHDVEIGAGAIVYANCTLYDDVQIGARTLIHANCVVHERTRIGADCVLQAGAVIGSEGHGFVPMADGSWHRMPQVGQVVIEDGVEVGANSTVDRPATGVTRLGRGTKLDNLVMVGHGCQIDENCMLIAQVGLGGGVKIGRNVVLAGQVGVADHVSIGERTVATAKTGIPGNIEAGALVSGYPAIPHNIWLRASAILRKLPELHQSVRDLQRRLAALQQRLDT